MTIARTVLFTLHVHVSTLILLVNDYMYMYVSGRCMYVANDWLVVIGTVGDLTLITTPMNMTAADTYCRQLGSYTDEFVLADFDSETEAETMQTYMRAAGSVQRGPVN